MSYQTRVGEITYTSRKRRLVKGTATEHTATVNGVRLLVWSDYRGVFSDIDGDREFHRTTHEAFARINKVLGGTQ